MAEASRILEAQHAFLTQHLGRWFSLFAAGVRTAEATGLYGLIAAADVFIYHDHNYLRVVRTAWVPEPKRAQRMSIKMAVLICGHVTGGEVLRHWLTAAVPGE
ncbi:hypothetical protein D6833_05860 [Candidatus Parcubacteria bacterium]|nr:MAG: hypothetical protein D6833_05860 [Candidatus Parcubacteria bacterium]